jgi:hypothetical protein
MEHYEINHKYRRFMTVCPPLSIRLCRQLAVGSGQSAVTAKPIYGLLRLPSAAYCLLPTPDRVCGMASTVYRDWLWALLILKDFLALDEPAADRNPLIFSDFVVWLGFGAGAPNSPFSSSGPLM